jgi:MOSC domain-containing protein YiiM
MVERWADGPNTGLYLGPAAIIEIAGLRNPCARLDRPQSGLKEAVLDRDAQGHLIRKAGVMGIVLSGGEARPSDPIRIEWPSEPHQPLEPV